jgi:hypothetical protein
VTEAIWPVLGLTAIVGAWAADNCKPQFEIGQTYAQIQAGPCPDIERQAFMMSDSTHTVYYCPSRKTAVVGDITTGIMVGFFFHVKD